MTASAGMKLRSVNPVTGQVVNEIDCWSEQALFDAVGQAHDANASWRGMTVSERCMPVQRCAELLAERREELAHLITREMGKVINESYAEIDKCIFTCEYYAEHGVQFLKDEILDSDASRSLVSYEPIGTVLGIMPWNFPLWQIIRCAIPALLSGNTVLLKHASNVPQCALAAEQLLHDAGIPRNVYRSLMINSSQVEPLFRDKRIRGIALTGSEGTGRQVAGLAGSQLKKTVLELGGSDAFVVLADADLPLAIETAIKSRFFTSGQSCINAKRIILVREIAEEFIERFTVAVNKLVVGDPMSVNTQVGPMVRADLRDVLHAQVMQSIQMGAVALTGCQPVSGPGFYYQASVLDKVSSGMPAYEEELFGPVAAILHADDEAHAVELANDSKYGLGGTVFTSDVTRGEAIARQINAGMVYINGLVKSDPRLPFGGTKHSGLGRELARHGMLEFCNAKTLWIA